jgi:hypothetical protein
MHNFRYFVYFILLGILSSCTADEIPTIDDYYLNYQIREIPVNEDIPVGAYLYSTNGFVNNDAVWNRITDPKDESNGLVGPYLMPMLGRYSISPGNEAAASLQQIIDWAVDAKIDFLVAPAVTENSNNIYPNNMSSGSVGFLNFIAGNDTMYQRVDLKDVKYCILVDMNSFCAGLTNNILLENVPATSIVVDGVSYSRTLEERLYSYFKRISDFFIDDSYYHINGKPMVILNSPERLYTSDSRRVYDAIRDTIKSHTGKDIYIVARQSAWTPPARYHYFYLTGGVDAVTMQNMNNVGAGNYDRIYWLHQFINENFKYNREYNHTHYNVDFIPNASPSYNGYISNGSYNIPHVNRSPDDFKKACNVAKMNLGKTPLVFIDSFNNWQYDSQIEPSDEDYGNGYGTTYLDIVREQFKK